MYKPTERCVTEQFQSFLKGFSFTSSSLQDVNLRTGVILESPCICNLLNKNKIQNYPIHHILKSCLSQKEKPSTREKKND